MLFILSLAGLAKQETAEAGNYYGIAGMAIALGATIFSPGTQGFWWIISAMLIGGAIGIRYAKKRNAELVALLHSFVGMAAVLVGFNTYINSGELSGTTLNIRLVEIFLGVFIGAVTFTGSVAAFGKLRGFISSKPLMLPHRHKLNLSRFCFHSFCLSCLSGPKVPLRRYLSSR